MFHYGQLGNDLATSKINELFLLIFFTYSVSISKNSDSLILSIRKKSKNQYYEFSLKDLEQVVSKKTNTQRLINHDKYMKTKCNIKSKSSTFFYLTTLHLGNI